MRLLMSMKKNILVLLRNRISFFALIFGPLIIMLLLGVVFTGTASYELTVGTYAPDDSHLTTRFIENMQDQGLVIREYNSIQSCIQQIKEGVLEVCAEFPPNFTIENNKTNTVIFYVDDSRANFVYRIIDTVTKNVGVESAEISKDLTGSILTTLWSTETGIDEAIGQLILIKAETNTIDAAADETSEKLNEQDLSVTTVDTEELSDAFDSLQGSYVDFRSEVDDIILEGRGIVSALASEAYAGTASYTAFNTSLNNLEDVVEEAVEEDESAEDSFDEAIASVSLALQDLYDQISLASTVREETQSSLDELKTEVESTRTNLDELKAHHEDLKNAINNLKVTSSETISNPIVTEVQPVVGRGDRLSFMFPYLLMVVVLFVGLMLSGSLVVMEKLAKSAFRRFTTPTGESLFLVANVLTSFSIIVVQLAIILSLAYYFLGDLLLENPVVFGGLLLLAAALFILMGTLLGYLFNTLEAVTMVSIALGSVFIFVSNLVLPIETLPAKFQQLSLFNPYVLASESLRKALLFGASFTALQREIIMLASISAILIAVIGVIRNVIRSKLLLHVIIANRNSADALANSFLKLGDDQIKDISDLVVWLKKVNQKRFEEELQWVEVRRWLMNFPQYRSLRMKLVGKKREQMIAILTEYLNKNK